MTRLRTQNRRARQTRRVIRSTWVEWLKHELWMRKRGKRTGGISEGTARWYLFQETGDKRYLT